MKELLLIQIQDILDNPKKVAIQLIFIIITLNSLYLAIDFNLNILLTVVGCNCLMAILLFLTTKYTDYENRRYEK